MNPSRSPHRTDNTKATPSSQTEGTSNNSRRFAHGKLGGGKVILLYSEDPYLASENNGHRTTFRFGRHRHVWR